MLLIFTAISSREQIQFLEEELDVILVYLSLKELLIRLFGVAASTVIFFTENLVCLSVFTRFESMFSCSCSEKNYQKTPNPKKIF